MEADNYAGSTSKCDAIEEEEEETIKYLFNLFPYHLGIGKKLSSFHKLLTTQIKYVILIRKISQISCDERNGNNYYFLSGFYGQGDVYKRQAMSPRADG